MGTYAYVNPIVAVGLGFVVLGEPLSAGLLSGAGLILLGVLLTTTAPRRRKRPVGRTPSGLMDEPSTTG